MASLRGSRGWSFWPRSSSHRSLSASRWCCRNRCCRWMCSATASSRCRLPQPSATSSPSCSSFVTLPFYLHSIGFTDVQIGLVMTPWPLSVALMAPVSGYLCDRYPPGIVGTVGLLLVRGGTGAARVSARRRGRVRRRMAHGAVRDRHRTLRPAESAPDPRRDAKASHRRGRRPCGHQPADGPESGGGVRSARAQSRADERQCRGTRHRGRSHGASARASASRARRSRSPRASRKTTSAISDSIDYVSVTAPAERVARLRPAAA